MSAFGIELAKKIYNSLGQRASSIAHSIAVAYVESREKYKKSMYNICHQLLVTGRRQYTDTKGSDLDDIAYRTPNVVTFVQEGYVAFYTLIVLSLIIT